MSDLLVRPSTEEDLPALGRLGAALVRLHHDWDRERFFLHEGVEDGYRRFLGGMLAAPDTVVLSAVRGGEVVGYAYGRLEPRNWNLLLDAHGALHDIYVDETARRGGVASALVRAMIDALKARGAARIVLSTAHANEPGRKLFARIGFRETMVEMTLEC